LQLAAETSGATGVLLGNAGSAALASAITRWRISSAPGKPGQRFDQPLWVVDLLYCRGGRPGKWILEWRGQKLNNIAMQAAQQESCEALAG
jgi:protein ImuA